MGLRTKFLSFFLLMSLLAFPGQTAKKKGDANRKFLVDLSDIKVFKKLQKTHTNLLVAFAKKEKDVSSELEVVSEVAKQIKGKGTVAFIDCGQNKKLCKKLKVSPDPLILKHFKDGEFNKEYDRKFTVKSMLKFMMNPTSDTPWEEENGAEDVRHVNGKEDLKKLLTKENKLPILLMFYAPWCGYCKRLKPDFQAAATELKGEAVLAGMDVDNDEGMAIRIKYNISGFPTIYYFVGGKVQFQYGGKPEKDDIIRWMRNPTPPAEKPKEEEWKDTPSEVVHLTDEGFDEFIAGKPSVLVMFYAPWCGHCKQMKPEYTEAAATLKDENIEGVLAAVDATKNTALGKRFDIKGYPTLIYFKDGENKYKVNERKADKFVEFMKDPKEPPPPPPPEPEWSDTPSEVIHLNDDDFRHVLKKKKHALVMFYAPWCGHCKSAKPEFQEAAANFAGNKKVAFAAVDCTKEKSVCEVEGVKGYPTLKYFNYGKNSFMYSGGRVKDDFIKFMDDPRDGPPPTPATPKETQWKDEPGFVQHLTDSDFEDFIASHDSILVMFYAPWCGHCKAMKPAYSEAAEELNIKGMKGVLAAVDCTTERKVAEKYKIKGYPTVKYFSKGKFAFEYTKGRSGKDLVAFMTSPQEPPPPPPPEPEWKDTPSEVNHLTEATFDEFIKSNPSTLVMFYAPWCGHCKQMKPAYTEAAEIVKNEGLGSLAAVDCTKEKGLAKTHEIKGFPTIKYFRDGKFAFKYTKGRTSQALVEFMKNPQAPPPPEPAWSTVESHVNHLTEATFDDFIKTHSSVLVMFYAPWCGHCKKMKPVYEEAADILTKDNVGVLAAVDCTVEKQLAKKHEIKGYPSLLHFKDGKYQTKYTEERSSVALVDFMHNPPKPEPAKPKEVDWSDVPSNVHHLTEENFDEHISKPTSTLVMFYAPWCGHCTAMKPALTEAAEVLAGEMPEVTIAAVDCTKHSKLGKKYVESGYPTVKYFKEGQEVREYEGDRSVDDLVEFMKEMDKPKPTMMPEGSWVTKHVHYLTQKSFNSFLKDSENALVMFYAPWCGHCKSAKPEFEKAAEKSKDMTKAYFASVDCTVQTDLCDAQGITGFPTIKYFNYGQNGVEYEGKRQAEAFISYMNNPPKSPGPSESRDEL